MKKVRTDCEGGKKKRVLKGMKILKIKKIIQVLWKK